MDLFEKARQARVEARSPLANRLRPRTLEEFIGQDHIVGPGRLLRRAIQADQLSSLIFYGPPGTGKTTLARVIANTTRSHFLTINAVLSGVKEIRAAIATASERRDLLDERTTLFVDEVHRWNKAQQDALLPHVENGTLILIGATTENPYFEVNKALVSRSRIFQLTPLTADNLRDVAAQALADEERGYGALQVQLTERALEHLVNVANGDARSLLNALELAVETTEPDGEGQIHIDLAVAEESIQRRAVLYDKDGDAHYDTISAFIKSVRGSDPDAALYWLAKMVYAGEDPRFIFRRLTILAGEDIGLAAPEAMGVVVNCWQAFERIGMPEGAFPLAEATIYLATAPKSNSALGYFDAYNAIRQEREGEVPNHLKDNNRDKEGFGHGAGYLYPHAYREHWVAQQYLPDGLQGKLFYQPGDQGYEAHIHDDVVRRREAQLAAMLAAPDETHAEVLTYSPQDRGREAWLTRAGGGAGRLLAEVRDRLFSLAAVERHHLLLDVLPGSGLLTWEALRQAPEGGVHVLTPDEATARLLTQQAARLAELDRPVIHLGAPEQLQRLLPEALFFDRILSRSPLTRLGRLTPAAQRDLFRLLAAHLRPEGRLLLAQPIPRLGQRLYQLVDWQGVAETLRDGVAAAEEAIYAAEEDPLVNWDVADLLAAATAAGLQVVAQTLVPLVEERRLTPAHWSRWFEPGERGDRPSYAARLAAAGLPADDVERVARLYRRQLLDKSWPWTSQTLFLHLRREETAV